MVLDASLLSTQHYKVRIKGKVEQSRKGVAPSPTHWCSSYRKGSLRVTLDYGRQLYLLIILKNKKKSVLCPQNFYLQIVGVYSIFLIYIYIYIYIYMLYNLVMSVTTVIQCIYQYRRTLSFQIRTCLSIPDYGSWRHEKRDTILKSLR